MCSGSPVESQRGATPQARARATNWSGAGLPSPAVQARRMPGLLHGTQTATSSRRTLTRRLLFPLPSVQRNRLSIRRASVPAAGSDFPFVSHEALLMSVAPEK